MNDTDCSITPLSLGIAYMRLFDRQPKLLTFRRGQFAEDAALFV